MRGILYKADLPRDLKVVEPFSKALVATAVFGVCDVVGVLGKVVVLLSNTNSCLGTWLFDLKVIGDSFEGLVPI